MTAAALTPRVRVMVVCDGIKPSQVEDAVFHLRGVRHYAAADSFPFTPRRFCVYLLLSSARKGRYPGYVRIIDSEAGKTISYRKLDPVPVFDEEVEFLPLPIRMPCEFPHAGRYLIEVWFFREETPDAIKAEQPFEVLQEA
jgi:hypothetical protein